jgi:hypothetical protein
VLSTRFSKLITVNLHLEVSEPNTMQSIIGVATAVCSFGAAYGAHCIFPTKPIAEGDILLSQSTIGTFNFLTRESLEKTAKKPRDLIDLYLKRKANLEDVVEIITGKNSIPEARAVLETAERTPENLFLLKAIKENYQ